jgi:hypothetical protein
MNRKTMFLCAAALAVCTHARADDAVCGTLESATNGQDGIIALREGESVNFWQPEGSGDIYVLANEGTSAVRLILTPPRGTKVDTGPGSLPPQKVLSCPAM